MHHKWIEIIGIICKTTNGKSYGTNSQQKVRFGQRMTLLSTDSRSIVKLITTQVDICMWHDFVLKGSCAVFLCYVDYRHWKREQMQLQCKVQYLGN